MVFPGGALVLPLALSAGCSAAAGESTSTSGASSMSSDAPTQEVTSESDDDGFHEAFTDSSGGEETGGSQNPNGPEVIDLEFCEIDTPGTADINGFTAAGPYAGRFAWFGWMTCNGEALSPTLVITETLEQLETAIQINPSGDAVPQPSLEFNLFGACDPSEGWVGEGIVTLYLRDASGWQQGRGRFGITQTHRMFDELDPFDPPRMQGVLEVDDEINGWRLDGEFTAAYCGPLSYALDCR